MMQPPLRIWRVPGSLGLAVAAAPGGYNNPSVSDPLTFVFPRAAMVEAIFALPVATVALPDPIDQSGQLSLVVVDEVQQPLFSDTRGTLRGTARAPVSAGLLMLQGFAANRYPLQRPVGSGDTWTFTMQNDDPANAYTMAGIFIYFRCER